MVSFINIGVALFLGACVLLVADAATDPIEFVYRVVYLVVGNIMGDTQ